MTSSILLYQRTGLSHNDRGSGPARRARYHVQPDDDRPLPGTRAGQLIEIARVTLAARRRETDPITHANRREVTLFGLERGLDLWSATDRRALTALMRAKGGHRERDFVRKVQSHRRLGEALASLATTTTTAP